MTFETGNIIEVRCPFVRTLHVTYDEDGQHEEPSWRPGIEWEECGPEDAEPVAHAYGLVRYVVVSVQPLPRPYQTRVYFTRKYVTPDGREFGTKKLHTMTLSAFRRRAVSYLPGGIERPEQIHLRPTSQEATV